MGAVGKTFTILFQVVVGGAAVAVAVISDQIWEAAKKNPASPGAIILVFISWSASLIAAFAAIGIVIQIFRRR